MKILKEVSKKDLKEFIYDIDVNDKKLYQEINDTTSFIFQFSGNLASSLVGKITPTNFNEIVAINSLARPGTMGFADDYKYSTIKYPKIVNDLLKETRFQVIYQEQIMSVFNKIGGFTLEETNKVRSLMKKLGKANKKQSDIDEWDKQVKRFISGAVKSGITESQAKEISNDLLQLSSYSFNKSHAVSYSFIAVQTLYFAKYFRKYFYSSNLAYEATKKDAIKNAIESCNKFNFKVLPPDVNLSGKNFTPVNGNNILFGLTEIKGIGEKPIATILENRPYKSIWDFVIKTTGKGVTKTVVSSLIAGGAFDSIDNNRKLNLLITEKYFEIKKTAKAPELLELRWNEAVDSYKDSNILTTTEDYIEYDKEYIGGNFFRSPFGDEEKEKIDILYKKGLIDRSFADITETKSITRVPVYVSKFRVLNDRNGNEMIFCEITDMNGTTISVPIFSSYWKFVKDRFSGEGMYIFALHRNIDDNIMFGSKNFTKDIDKPKLLNAFKKKS